MSIYNKRFDYQVNAIQTLCYVVPFDAKENTSQYAFCCPAPKVLWDTGATDTIISQKVVEALGLVPVGKCNIEGIGGIVDAFEYKISIYIEGKMKFAEITALASEDCGYDLIIGMDVIGLGDFAITNKDGQTWFAFRHPSQDHIEFH